MDDPCLDSRYIRAAMLPIFLIMFHFRLKLHALVEYETIAQAEKAVSYSPLEDLITYPTVLGSRQWLHLQIAELNDENWRKGLRVRLLLRRSVSITDTEQ